MKPIEDIKTHCKYCFSVEDEAYSPSSYTYQQMGIKCKLDNSLEGDTYCTIVDALNCPLIRDS